MTLISEVKFDPQIKAVCSLREIIELDRTI